MGRVRVNSNFNLFTLQKEYINVKRKGESAAQHRSCPFSSYWPWYELTWIAADSTWSPGMRAREANTLPKRSHKVARLSLKLLIQSWITFTVLILCSLVLQHYLSGSLHGISTGPGPDLNWHSCFSPSLPSMTLNAGSHVIMQQVVLGPSTRVPLM